MPPPHTLGRPVYLVSCLSVVSSKARCPSSNHPPAEWYDNRGRKTNPNAPDFKKKVGGRDGEPQEQEGGLVGLGHAVTCGACLSWSVHRPAATDASIANPGEQPLTAALPVGSCACSPCAVADEPRLPGVGALRAEDAG